QHQGPPPANSTEKPNPTADQARVEAAQAQVELAQMALHARILNSPLDGRVTELPAVAGQFVAKGDPIATVSDASTVRAVVPVERGSVKVGAELSLPVEGRTAKGTVRALVPLPEAFATLHELAIPWVAAVVE